MFRSTLFKSLLKASWPIFTVLVFHQALLQTPYRVPLDFVMHSSGGVAISYFIYFMLELAAPILGTLKQAGRYLFTFSMACTVGLFWEFAEMFSDYTRGTHIQHSLPETLHDLIADATGSFILLTLIIVYRHFSSNTRPKRK